MMRYATEKDIDELKKLWKIVFKDSDEFLNWLFKERFMPDLCYCLYDDDNGKIISALHGYPMKINISGKFVPAVLISGVLTIPEKRGKGEMKKLFEGYLNYLYSLGYPLVFYTPENPEVYSFTGHKKITRSAFIESLPQKKTGKYDMKNIDISENMKAMALCYKKMAETFCGMAERGSYYEIKMHEYICEKYSCAAAFNGSTIAAYVIYKETSVKTDVIEAVGEKDALTELCTSLKKPCNGFIPFEYAVSCSKQSKFSLGGITNVKNFLSLFNIKCPLSIKVTDELIPSNCALVDFCGNQTEKPADITLDSGRLLQLYMGYISPDELGFDDTVTETLNKYFCLRPSYCCDLY